MVVYKPFYRDKFLELVFIAKKWYNKRYEKRISSNKCGECYHMTIHRMIRYGVFIAEQERTAYETK